MDVLSSEYLSANNSTFYPLFSRKYRLPCIRTMKRIIHCKRHRRRLRYNQNFQKKDKPPLGTGTRHPLTDYLIE
jgi:hypothetical protein